MKRRHFLKHGSIVFAATLSGCGGSSADAPASALPAPTPPSPTPTPPSPSPSPIPSGPGLPTLSLHPSQSGTLPYQASVFPLEGAVPAGRFLVSPDDVSLRSSVLSTWPDGSAKVMVVAGHAQVSGSLQKTVNLGLNAGTDSAGTALTTAAIASVFTTGITVDFGGGTRTLNTWTNPDHIWWSNSQVICARYRLACGVGMLEAVIDVHAFSGGRAFVEIVVENCKLNSASPSAPSPANYAGATISVNGGASIAGAGANSSAGPGGTHQAFRAWYCSTWIGSDPAIEVTHDTAWMQGHPMMQRVWKPTNQNLQTIYQSDAYAPWSTERLNVPGMGSTGDHPAIGSFSQWDTRYLQSGDKYVRRACIASALAALSGNINWRDTTTGLVPTFAQIGLKNIQTSNWPSQGGEPGWEHAHSPSVGFMAFLCQPSPVFIEIAQKAAVWQRIYGNNTGTGQKRALGSSYQVRGKAWTLRAWNQATFLTPNTVGANVTAWKTACQSVIYEGLQLLDDYRLDPYNVLGVTWDYAPGYYQDYGDPGFQQPIWENHYLIVEAAKGASSKILDGAQHALYVSFADWACKQPIRWINEAAAGEWRAISRYQTQLGDGVLNPIGTHGDGTYTQHWAAVYSDSPPANSGQWLGIGGGATTWASASNVTDTSGAYYDAYFWAAFCMAVERGVSGADAAWSKVVANITNLDFGISAWSAKFQAEPRWGFYPRNK